ncbi:hypothetical protein CC2G_002404 [Coprinopsis cinerea AmutBmut pab1-1]|nr:hypothetical protein CC2G_002404 [Coprinopsis cinerea AmutBmut pab1-1]
MSLDSATASLEVLDFDDSVSSGAATPRPPTPKSRPNEPPPVEKPKFKELELDDDDDFGNGGPSFLATFELGSTQALDGLSFHSTQASPVKEGLLLVPEPPPRNSNRRRSKRKTEMTQITPEQAQEQQQPQDQTTQAQLKELSTAEMYDKNQQLFNESIPDVPLVSELAPMATLRAEYENGSASFVSQIDWLVGQGYTGIRRARGDGDCFYRSLAFAYIDQLLHTPPEHRDLKVGSSLSILESTRTAILLSGTDEFILEEPYAMFTALIQNITTPNKKGFKLDSDRLLARFQDQATDPSVDEEDEPVPAYIVYYLRMIASAHLKNNSDQYSGFFYDAERDLEMTAVDFCSRFVDPVGVEADHVQMLALCRELKINLNVAYLDGHKSDSVDFVTFKEGPEDQEPITLLYRPGHYDILAKRAT